MFRQQQDISILNQHLADSERLGSSNVSANEAVAVRDFIARALLPGEVFAEKSPYDADEATTLNPAEVAKFHHTTSDGLRLLSQLCSRYPIQAELEPEDIALTQCAASFTDINDPWTCESSKTTALGILDSSIGALDSKALSAALSDLLRECIKPAFAAGKRNPATTPQGRRALYDSSPVDSSTVVLGEAEKAASPWKHRDIYVVTVLRWLIQSLSLAEPAFIHQTYPQLTPPILTLIDDTSPAYKAKGLNILTLLLPQTPPKLLAQTGLSEVFEQSLFPCLAYLPPLSEEKEALKLQRAAYPALLSLARARGLDSKETGQGQGQGQKLLDRLMREGVLAGYAQAGEHVAIADFLTKQMGIVVVEMGMGWTQYLKRLIPLLSSNLSSPFALTFPPLLISTLETLQTIILIAWPRIPYYRFDILKGLTVCWCRIADEESKGVEVSEELRAVQLDIQRTVKVLTVTLKHEKLDVQEEYGRIVEDGDQRLKGLLVV